jgi:hypothetical protein
MLEQQDPHYKTEGNSVQSLVFSLVLVEQELLTIPVHLSSPPSYRGVLAAQTLVFCLVLVEQELLTFLLYLSSSPSYSGVLAAQSLVFYVVFYWSFCPFSFNRYIACPSSIYVF